jgi:hypothetical protein
MSKKQGMRAGREISLDAWAGTTGEITRIKTRLPPSLPNWMLFPSKLLSREPNDPHDICAQHATTTRTILLRLFSRTGCPLIRQFLAQPHRHLLSCFLLRPNLLPPRRDYLLYSSVCRTTSQPRRI